MTTQRPSAALDKSTYAQWIQELLVELFPICRSIMGDGIRQSLDILSHHIPLERIEFKTGTKVLDWEIPQEWTIRDAYIKNSKGERIVDFKKSNLHVINYSVPVRKKMNLTELKPYLHTLPGQPKAIPYLTTYYDPTWGFCLNHNQFKKLRAGTYDVCIDSELKPGRLVLGEKVLPGESDQEVLISSYACHPSLANNELSGPILTAMLYRHLASLPKRRLTYRFYIGPETIGAIAYLSLRGDHFKEKLLAGLVATCCGDNGNFTYKQTRQGETPIDRAVVHALQQSGLRFKTVPFFPSGSDERQYSSPGYNLSVGSLMRSMYGTYPGYHNSLDNLDFVNANALFGTLQAYVDSLYTLEQDAVYRNLKPYGEPHLSKYALTHSSSRTRYTLLRYILNYSDGHHSLLSIADKAGVAIWDCVPLVQDLVRNGLLEPIASNH